MGKNNPRVFSLHTGWNVLQIYDTRFINIEFQILIVSIRTVSNFVRSCFKCGDDIASEKKPL